MNQDKANSLARAAGAAGRSYSDFCCSDEWTAAVDEIDASGGDVDSRALEAAYCEGRRKWRLAGGWKTAWTIAPADYDGFGTETAGGPFEWDSRSLRRVIIDPNYFSWQTGRYPSFSDEDPRVTEVEIIATLNRERAEREACEQRRAEGLTWIRTAEVDGDDDLRNEEARAHGLRWEDVRAERRRRAEEKVAAERAAKWAVCRAAFKDGDTLVDDGAPSRAGQYGFRIPGRKPAVYRSVVVLRHYETDDVEQSTVITRTRSRHGFRDEFIGSLENVAGRIERNELRIARPDEVFPPKPVVDRLLVPWKDVFRAPSGVWIGRPLFGSELVVLDDNAHLVRKKAVVEAALVAYREKMFGGAPKGLQK